MTHSDANAGQAEYWSSEPGQNWIAHEELLDTLVRGATDRLLARADPRPGERVLDIGCGTGRTTREIARRVGSGGRAIGIDISGPMLERARAGAEDVPQLVFVRADAQLHPFEPESADLVASRFGVMFFDDPVAAFANMRRALRPGGRLCFVTWAEAAGNPWFTIPREIAVARLGEPMPQPPTAPGPLALADRDRVRRILTDAGFGDVEAEAEPMALAWPHRFEKLLELATSLGPAVRILREKGGGAEDRAAIREGLAAALARFAGPDGIRIPALFNFFAARNA